MSHQFDSTMKELVETHAADFVSIFGLPADSPPTALNIDLSTLTAATDVTLGFGDPLTVIADLNFQSGPDPQLESRLLIYNAALRHRYRAPVRSLLILLRPGADHSRLTGHFAYATGSSRVEFRYETIRMGQLPPEPFLTGGLGLLPLATLCQLPSNVPMAEAMTQIVAEIDRRLIAETERHRAVRLMSAAFILSGLRVEREALSSIFEGVRVMHESSAFELLDEWEARGAHRIILRQARKRFGAPPAADEALLRSFTDVDRLERISDAISTAESWAELLATP